MTQQKYMSNFKEKRFIFIEISSINCLMI